MPVGSVVITTESAREKEDICTVASDTWESIKMSVTNTTMMTCGYNSVSRKLLSLQASPPKLQEHC